MPDTNIAERLEILTRDLTPLGMQTAAMLLLAEIGRRAERAPDPVGGRSLIKHIADAACEYQVT